ncbi:FAD-dependent oxidoreductase (plasmid) [Deinococcus sp. KNUC1210]|uniref:NAD(P)/FAD-dependent oxidoreductase n=1 Tax=Deinococcus sp. KNUC1210 TaxID=2917691 RepID=UPI001EF071FB|nr:FAD-dependent oxidoreductase [Deinococcus sp. KNUC1210]ULH17176.1 FAD-dependent oxidoreductase [Deinococcus sp. KNUC1210]
MTTGTPPHTLIIGAGLAGLALARELTRAGQHVTVLDKAHGVSGRSSTRRMETQPTGELARLDHGARFFTARTPRTLAMVQEGLTAGWLAEWTRRVPSWSAGRVSEEPDGHPRYVPPAGMSTLGKELAQGLTVTTGALVTRLQQHPGGWLAECQDGRQVTAEQLVLNMPAPQILPLLEGTVRELARLRDVTFAPCWAVGAVLTHDLNEVDWPALRILDHPALEWLAREHTKRPPGHPPALMLHARADWSQAHLNDERGAVLEALLAAAREVVGPFEVSGAFAHRWLYATPTQRFPGGYGWLREAALGWCGDWCSPDPHGPRVEAALLSGWQLSDALLSRD